MICYTTATDTTSSWAKKVLLLLFLLSSCCDIMQVPGVAGMTTTATRHDVGHHHLRGPRSLHEGHEPTISRPNRTSTGTSTISTTARNRTRDDNDGSCDPAWEQEYEVYRSIRENMWTDPICYSYDFALSCLCPVAYTKPMRIAVYNDTVVNVTFLEPSISAVPDDRARPTMNMLLEKVYEDCFEGCPDNGRAQECFITFDAASGNIELYIDYSKLRADDELVSIACRNGTRVEKIFPNDFFLFSCSAMILSSFPLTLLVAPC
jgi:Family of unknown function (DUF6174)